jgi:hypothetical protein
MAAKNKSKSKKSFLRDHAQVILLVGALVLGFTGGIVYMHLFDNKPPTTPTPILSPIHICNCPMEPAGTPGPTPEIKTTNPCPC